MTRSEITSKLTAVFREVLFQPQLEIHEDTTAADVKNWDSLNHVTMIFAAEQKFGVTFSTREIQGLHNVGELIKLIERKTSS